MSQFVKKFGLPAEFTAPRLLQYEDIKASALTRADLDDDLAAVNASVELIQKTRGGGWPTGPVTEDFDFVDLVWHEQEFREGTSFAYVVRDPGGSYLGCFYLYPMGLRTMLTDELAEYDVDVSWWVTADAFAAGYYAKLYEALREWMAAEFPFWRPYYSNSEMPPGT